MLDTGMTHAHTLITLTATATLSLMFRIAVPKSFAWCSVGVVLISGCVFALLMCVRLAEFAYLMSTNPSYGHGFFIIGTSPRVLAFELAKQTLLLTPPIAAAVFAIMPERRSAIWC